MILVLASLVNIYLLFKIPISKPMIKINKNNEYDILIAQNSPFENKKTPTADHSIPAVNIK